LVKLHRITNWWKLAASSMPSYINRGPTSFIIAAEILEYPHRVVQDRGVDGDEFL
jgi:hypothetical protein